MHQRPTAPELYGKINHAIAALKAGRRGFGTLRHWAEEKYVLGLKATEEVWELLLKLLSEIKDARPEQCYAGTEPPQRSYEDEPAIKGAELWAFSWESLHFKKRMYLKFVLKKSSRGEWWYFYIDCHPSASK